MRTLTILVSSRFLWKGRNKWFFQNRHSTPKELLQQIQQAVSKFLASQQEEKPLCQASQTTLQQNEADPSWSDDDIIIFVDAARRPDSSLSAIGWVLQSSQGVVLAAQQHFIGVTEPVEYAEAEAIHQACIYWLKKEAQAIIFSDAVALVKGITQGPVRK